MDTGALRKLLVLFMAVAPYSGAYAQCSPGYTARSYIYLCYKSLGPGVQAVSVNTFLNSLGANTHIGQGDPEQPYEAEFAYTGIRHARDGVAVGGTAPWIALHNNTVSATHPGVSTVIGNEYPPSNQVRDGNILAAAGALFAFEGPNEPNNYPIFYNGQTGGSSGTWVPVAQFQHDLYAAVKADPTANNFPVFGPSEIGAETDNVGLQCLVLDSSCPGAPFVTLMPASTAYQDYMNAHNYIAAHATAVIDNMAWQNADPESTDDTWDSAWVEWGQTWAHNYQGYSHGIISGVPRVTTETGWESGTIGQEPFARLMMNIYLAQFKRGWFMTSVYQMEDNRGGYRNTAGFFGGSHVAKPAATYMHNFTTVLAEKVDFTPGSLGYTIPSEPATVHDLLLEKSNGTFYLVIWDERKMGRGTDNITVGFDAAQSGAVYDTTTGTSAISTFTGQTSVALTMTDHPMIVRVGP